MVEKPSVSAFQNFFRIENWLNIKSYGQECVYVFCIDSVNIDSIECIRDPCLVSTVLTYIVLMVWLKVSVFQNFFWIENWLNIKKVMGRNVWMCFDSSIDSLDKHSIQCIGCFDLHIDNVEKQYTILNTQ